MDKVSKVNLQPKVKVKTPTVYIRSVSKEVKLKFYTKAKELGYTPREYFEELIKNQ